MRTIFTPLCLTGLLLLNLPYKAGAQVFYNNAATVTVSSGASLMVNGDLTNAAASTINNSGSLIITGNTVNNGAFNAPAAGTLRLEGIAAQSLGGSTPVNTKNIVVNNAAGITLATPLNVDGAMTFTSGIITAGNGSYPVTFSANSSLANTPTDASHIDGYVKKQGTGSFTFPTGDAMHYEPLGISLSANAGGITARYYPANAGTAPYSTNGSSPTPLLYYNQAEYWYLSPASTATGAVSIYFDGYNNSGIGSTADLRVAHLSGGQWRNEGGTPTGTVSAGSVTSNSISTFSPFTLGSISANSPLSNNPLPVKLLSFRAKEDGARTRLDWETAEEDPGTLFTIERSGDGSLFESIGDAAGKGRNAAYTFYDEQPLSPLAWYRLKSLEAGGSYSYSQTIALRREGPDGSSITLFPVPATDKITVTATNAALNGTPALVVDMQGSIVHRFTMETSQEIDVRGWPAGSYALRLADGTTLRLTKL